MQYHMMQCHTMQYYMIQCNDMQYHGSICYLNIKQLGIIPAQEVGQSFTGMPVIPVKPVKTQCLQRLKNSEGSGTSLLSPELRGGRK